MKQIVGSRRTAALPGTQMDDHSASILEIENLSKKFGNYVAVHPIDLSIRSGEFVTLLGPSGCGKTTLLRMISGLEAPSTGRLSSEGVDLTRLRPERRPFNMVFQSYALFPHLSVFENVAYGLRAAGLDEKVIVNKVDAALEMVGLSSRRANKIDELSGGMSQRVALVRAVVNQPKILLLDEPLAALDLQLRKKMQLELREIQQRLGTTFILVTHDQEESLVMSDRIVVMQAGRIEQVGTPKDIYLRPQTRFVAEFIGETSLAGCEVVAVGDGRVEVRFPNEAGGKFRYFCARDFGPGDAGAVSLRPEDIAVVERGEGIFEGTVTSVVFTGRTTRLAVSIAPGFDVHAIMTNDESIRVGHEVGIAILTGAGVFIHNK